MSNKPKKQARKLTADEEVRVLERVKTTRHPTRNKLMFLLSVKAGLRVMEIAQLRWWMLIEEGGNTVRDQIYLPFNITKSKSRDRYIDIGNTLREAIEEHYAAVGSPHPKNVVLESERGGQMHINYVTRWFFYIYRELKMYRCSSHSGRRTFINNMGNAIIKTGGTLFDVMQMVGHRNLSTTQTYMSGNPEARRSAVNLI